MLVGCGGLGPSVHVLRRPAGSQHGSTGSITTPSRLPASTAGSVPACPASSLTVTTKVLGLAAEHAYGQAVLTNSGDAACSVGGEPQLAFTTPSGATLYTLHQSPLAIPGVSGSIRVKLAPNGQASFVSEVIGDCPGGPRQPLVEGKLAIRLPEMAGVLYTAPAPMRTGCSSLPVMVSAIMPGVMTRAPGFGPGG